MIFLASRRTVRNRSAPTAHHQVFFLSTLHAVRMHAIARGCNRVVGSGGWVVVQRGGGGVGGGVGRGGRVIR